MWESALLSHRLWQAAGHDLYANEGTNVPARGQAIVATGIAIGLPHNTYGQIALAPRSSLGVKHWLMTNPGMIDADYRGEVKVILANLGDQQCREEKGDRIAQLSIEKIDNRGTTRSSPFGWYQHQQNVKTSPGPPRGVMVPLVLLVHPDPPWSTFSVKVQKVWIRMDRSGPGGPRGPQPPLVGQERSGPPWTTLRHFPDEEGRSGIRKLQHHDGPERQGPKGQITDGNQWNIGRTFQTVLPMRENNGHPKMKRSQQWNLAGSYQHQSRAGDKEDKRTMKTKMSETWSLENIITRWIYSKKERRKQYHPIDQVSIWELTSRKERWYQSRRYPPSALTNWRSSIDTSNTTRIENGFKEGTQKGLHQSLVL